MHIFILITYTYLFLSNADIYFHHVHVPDRENPDQDNTNKENSVKKVLMRKIRYRIVEYNAYFK